MHKFLSTLLLSTLVFSILENDHGNEGTSVEGLPQAWRSHKDRICAGKSGTQTVATQARTNIGNGWMKRCLGQDNEERETSF